VKRRIRSALAAVLDTVLSCFARRADGVLRRRVMRYVFNLSLRLAGRGSADAIVWIVFFGGRYAFAAGNHCAIDVWWSCFPKKGSVTCPS
jgi:TRAP-type mannitol/chloroaromatic compound transport system permease small subunit